jgi:5-(carboxyamino)imidazole ribonucleotide synthase
MANLLGDLWQDGEPDWAAACGFPTVKLHLYGKAQPRPGRKMGHLTALAVDAGAARDRVLAARAALTGASRGAAGPPGGWTAPVAGAGGSGGSAGRGEA